MNADPAPDLGRLALLAFFPTARPHMSHRRSEEAGQWPRGGERVIRVCCSPSEDVEQDSQQHCGRRKSWSGVSADLVIGSRAIYGV